MGVYRLTRTFLITAFLVSISSNGFAVLPPFDFVRDATAHHRAKNTSNAKLTVTQLGRSVLTWTASVTLFDNQPFALTSPTRTKSIHSKTSGLQWQLLWLAVAASDPANEVAERGLSPDLTRVMVNGGIPVVKYGGRASIQTDIDSRRIRRIRFVSKKKTIWTAQLEYDGDRLVGVTVLKNNATRLRAKLDHPK